MIKQYTSVNIILDKILRHPLLQDVDLEQAVDYTVDFLRIVGVPDMFEDKIDHIEISNHKGLLPCDIYEIIQIKNEKGGHLRHASDTFHLSHRDGTHKDGTFTTQGNYIYTAAKSDKLEISYRAIKTDSDGYPVIPDSSSLFRALQAYIKKEHFTILFDLGKISMQSLELARQDYAWAVGAAQTDLRKMDLSKAESFINSFRTLIIRGREFDQGWRKDNFPEILKYN